MQPTAHHSSKRYVQIALQVMCMNMGEERGEKAAGRGRETADVLAAPMRIPSSVVSLSPL